MDADQGGWAAVLTSDEELLDRLLTTLAAVGLEPRVVSDPGAVRGQWREATVVLVGGDCAEQLAALGLPRRRDLFVVGDDADRDLLCRWSVPLGAAVASLPSAESWFTAALGDAAGTGAGAGRLVAVVGGSGGVGASTCAAALATTAAASGRRSVLVDADPLGGGLDLLMGAEHIEGWRWPQLARASGHLGDLSGLLPQVDGIDLLASGRGGPPTSWLTPGPLLAVLRSTARSHDLTVLDLPRWLSGVEQEATVTADLVLVLVRADLRGLAAARELAGRLPDQETQVLLRGRRGAAVGPELVEQTLGWPVVATVADESAVRAATERGEPPARSRSALAKVCRWVLEQLPTRAAA